MSAAAVLEDAPDDYEFIHFNGDRRDRKC